MLSFADFQTLLIERRANGVLIVTLNRPEVLNAASPRMHMELAEIWRTIAADPFIKAVVITGAGAAFSRGGDENLLKDVFDDPALAEAMVREASAIVYNLLALDVPVISAINGLAAGAGLAVALLADISVMAEGAQLTDGHARIGVSAGDHAAIVWPLLCGIAKAKYYLLTGDCIGAVEAERIGLVTMCVPNGEALGTATTIADRLAAGSKLATRYTKKAMNGWLRMAGPIFDQSIAAELLCFLNPDAREGITALREGRIPRFPSAREGGAAITTPQSEPAVVDDWNQFYRQAFGIDPAFRAV